MRALTPDLRRELEKAVLAGRKAAEMGVRAAITALGVAAPSKPGYLSGEQAQLRRGLRAKQRQLGGEHEVLVWECAYEQWHRLLFARFLAENGLLRHPEFAAPVTIAECEDLASDLGEPDGWSVAARFAAEIVPGIFRLADPSVRLRLAPEHRQALQQIVAKLPPKVFTADDSLGWVYQYWQSERKDKVNASGDKIGGADIGPVTQLFTENYMVRFLLENSLGAWWAARNPDSPLVNTFDYLRFDEDGHPATGSFETWPDRASDVTMMDPCCGSGHFLVEGFGMLWRMRAEEEGLEPVEAQDAVLRDNLFGLEIDPRCVQIAMFAVVLAAWKQGGGWRRLPVPNIACSGTPVKGPLEEWTALAGGDRALERALERLHGMFRYADTLGSLINPRRAGVLVETTGFQSSFTEIDWRDVAPWIDRAAGHEAADPATEVLGANASGIARAADLLSRTYTLCATNVPYLSRQSQTEVLREHASTWHAAASADLATTLIDRWHRVTRTAAVVAPQNWEFLGSYRAFRENLLERQAIILSVRLGANAFESISGEVVKPVVTILGQATNETVLLADFSGEAMLPALLKSGNLRVLSSSTLLQSPAGVVSSRITVGPTLDSIATSHQGLITGDNERFLRFFWEIRSESARWNRVVTSPGSTRPYTGRDRVLDWTWERQDAASGGSLARVQGRAGWGRRGIVVGRVGELHATLSCGEIVVDKGAAVTPNREEDLPALWAFATSAEYRSEVRSIDAALAVSTSSLVRVRFDAVRWRAAGASAGLPEPHSDDPTQWLFKGRSRQSAEPLQVAVARLLRYRWPQQADGDELDEFSDRDGIVCLPAVAGELPGADRLHALLACAFGNEWSAGSVRRLLQEGGSAKKNLTDWLRDDFFKHHCTVFKNRPFIWHIWDGRSDGFAALVNYQRLNRANLEKLTYTYLGQDWIERQRADAAAEVPGADLRLAAAHELKAKLEAILEGEPPYDIYVRWKKLHEQPIGWEPDLDDGVRLNVRPFVEAGVLRRKFSIHWRKDRGKNSDGSERRNDLHFTSEEKRQARREAGVA